jgi:hypothetical protein
MCFYSVSVNTQIFPLEERSTNYSLYVSFFFRWSETNLEMIPFSMGCKIFVISHKAVFGLSSLASESWYCLFCLPSTNTCPFLCRLKRYRSWRLWKTLLRYEIWGYRALMEICRLRVFQPSPRIIFKYMVWMDHGNRLTSSFDIAFDCQVNLYFMISRLIHPSFYL